MYALGADNVTSTAETTPCTARVARPLTPSLVATISVLPSFNATMCPVDAFTAAMLLVYVLKGGDILTAVATVSKAFGGP